MMIRLTTLLARQSRLWDASARSVALRTVTLIVLSACSRDSGSASATTERDSNTTTAATLPSRPETAEPVPPNGAALPRVTLAPAAFTNAGIEIATATSEPAGAPSGGLEVPAVVALDPARIAIVSSRAAGRLERVTAVPGQRVGNGETVAYLTSPAYLTAQSDYVQARRRLVALSGSPDEQGARALLRAARDRLALLGASGGSISRLDAGGDPTLTLAVPAPLSGSILETMALAGSAVEPGTPILRIADLSSVDVVAQLPQQALAAVRPGQTAWVTVPAFGPERFTGRIVRLHDVADSSTRTVGAVVRVTNSTGRLRPGMFATARLAVPSESQGSTGRLSASGEALVVVPQSAIVTDGGDRYLFVAVAPRTFERRRVVIESLTPSGSMAPTSRSVIVRSGLKPGERIVVRGAFTLQSELAKSKLGESEG